MCRFNVKNDSRRLDPCMKNIIELLKKSKVKTVGCCCGHFKYHMTIICEDKKWHNFDLVSGVIIPRRKRSYVKDNKGLMYIPEVEEFWKNRLKKKILWIRKLSCGHSRPTNINFISGNYDKPKVGKTSYCRECWKEVKILSVRRSSTEDIKVLNKISKIRIK